MAYISTMRELGSPAPNFSLPDTNPNTDKYLYTLSDFSGSKALLVAFICNHCPYVVGSEPRIEAIVGRARQGGLGFAGINANDPVDYESDSWEHMVKRADRGMTYSYLHDASQEVAAAYGAERTPEFYLMDSTGLISYRGRMDDSPRDPSHATTSELADAIDEMLSGVGVTVPRTDSIGCSVKWKM